MDRDDDVAGSRRNISAFCDNSGGCAACGTGEHDIARVARHMDRWRAVRMSESLGV